MPNKIRNQETGLISEKYGISVDDEPPEKIPRGENIVSIGFEEIENGDFANSEKFEVVQSYNNVNESIQLYSATDYFEAKSKDIMFENKKATQMTVEKQETTLIVKRDSFSNQNRHIEVITSELLYYKQQRGEAAYMIGKLLLEAKNTLIEYGNWLSWLYEVKISERKAQRLMQIANGYSNPSTLSDFGESKSLALLSIPEMERNSFIQRKYFINGIEKSVGEMTTRELKNILREYNVTQKKPTIKTVNDNNYKRQFDCESRITDKTLLFPEQYNSMGIIPPEVKPIADLLNRVIPELMRSYYIIENPSEKEKKDFIDEVQKALENVIFELESLSLYPDSFEEVAQ